MESKKPSKPSKKDIAWQDKVEKQIKAEKLKLNNPKGKERFAHALNSVFKKK
jgi:hypothetical protein